MARVYVPTRVYKCQVSRPQQLACIEADGAARQQTALDQRQREIRAFRANERPLHPCREKPRRGAQREPRKQRLQIPLPLDPAALPPEDNQQRGWKCRGNRSEERRECKQSKCQQVPDRKSTRL